MSWKYFNMVQYKRLGAVLMQQGKPLAFFGQALSDRGRL